MTEVYNDIKQDIIIKGFHPPSLGRLPLCFVLDLKKKHEFQHQNSRMNMKIEHATKITMHLVLR